MLTSVLKTKAISDTAMMKRNGDKCYSFEDEAAVGKLLNGLVHIEWFGVPNRNVSLLMSSLAHLVLPIGGALRVAA